MGRCVGGGMCGGECVGGSVCGGVYVVCVWWCVSGWVCLCGVCVRFGVFVVCV